MTHHQASAVWSQMAELQIMPNEIASKVLEQTTNVNTTEWGPLMNLIWRAINMLDNADEKLALLTDLIDFLSSLL
jgi:hypothetical protein